MKDGWNQYTSTPPSVPFMRDYLMNIFFARTAAANRGITALSGTLGKIFFHEALVAIANGFLTVDSHFIAGSGSVGQTPGLAYGAQYTKYRGPEGINIDLSHYKLYDDFSVCLEKHPLYPDKPLDSARITFVNFAGRNGESNVQFLEEKDSFTHGIRLGMVG